MIYVLAVLALGGYALSGWLAWLAHVERQHRFEANLQSIQEARAEARRPWTTAPTKAEVQAESDTLLEAQASGLPYTASNPFGGRPPEGKPLGV